MEERRKGMERRNGGKIDGKKGMEVRWKKCVEGKEGGGGRKKRRNTHTDARTRKSSAAIDTRPLKSAKTMYMSPYLITIRIIMPSILKRVPFVKSQCTPLKLVLCIILQGYGIVMISIPQADQ